MRRFPSLSALIMVSVLVTAGAAGLSEPAGAQESPAETERPAPKTADARSQPIFADPLPQPKTLRETRDVLWSAHILNNTLRNAVFLATQAEALTAPAPAVRPKIARKGAAPQDGSATPFAEARETVARLYRELGERAFETRLRRIEIALQTLETSADIGERFLAAYAIGVDGEQLQM